MKNIFNISVFISTFLCSELAFGQTPTTVAPQNNDDFWKILFLVILIVGTIAISIAILQIRSLINKVYPKNSGKIDDFEAAMQSRTFWQKVAGLRPMQYEQKFMLDHNYDGIHEIDNPVPGWFMTLFYGTIFFSVVYLFVYHVVGDGNIMLTEYKQQMDEGEQVRASFIKKFANSINENSVVVLKDTKGIEEGKKIFDQNCVACHSADGGGGVGPNLTDEYWLHGGNAKSIFQTITEGVPEKGMISWKKTLNPLQIEQVESYIFTLKGTKPANPKAPQGDKE